MASLNNGVVICEKCAVYHKTWGTHISYVKSLTTETWSDEEVMYLQSGGNQRYSTLMKEYGLSPNNSIEIKYSVMAADYYRKLIFCELNEKEKPVKPDMKTGQTLITKFYEELNAPKKGFFGKLDSVFSDVKSKISQGAQDLDQKYDLKGKGAQAMVFANSAKDKIVEKGNEFCQNPTVKDLTKKTEEGFSKMVEVTKKTLGVDQQNPNQVQQNQNTDYPTQSHQNNDNLNQPFTSQNQGYAPPNLQNQNQNNVNIQTNYPQFQNQNQNNNQQPKQG
jgi:hypothetical protein